jgi:excisionase family DNA binding protein
MPAHHPHNHRPARSRPDQPNTTSDTGINTADPTTLLYTPDEAAALLRVRASWLRKKAVAREVPCTFLGKHLRFSPADLAAIVTASARPAVGRRRPPPTVRDRDLIDRPDRRVHAPDPDDHNHADGSNPWPG